MVTTQQRWVRQVMSSRGLPTRPDIWQGLDASSARHIYMLALGVAATKAAELDLLSDGWL